MAASYSSSQGKKLMVADVLADGGKFRASTPKELFSAPVTPGFSNDSHRWQLSPDGNRILLMLPASATASAYMDVVAGWEQLLTESRR